MKVRVHLMDGDTALDGEAEIFDIQGEHPMDTGTKDNVSPPLANLGFWVQHPREGKRGRFRATGSAFVPWSNCLYVEELEG